ncbi:VOC family protein [Porphyrobacter sp. ULC335]|uniref:VOC family protein n=1 Tax=Porphyrobacter sp. ULC335 TaxID=2854260 RepID=UPI00221FC0FD|nr:VOC family protein [Porphyrobacter sp. ULC335]UYV16673.1 VOC family protein [Porphyrobacter sp. ULC335]
MDQQQQAPEHGDFNWYELMTPNPDAAQGFYSRVLGWSFGQSEAMGRDYRMIHADAGPVGGVLTLDAGMQQGGTAPGWVGYVVVNDIGVAQSVVRDAGGQIMMDGFEVAGVGSCALAVDPEGVPFYCIEDRSGHVSNAFARNAPIIGSCAWNELSAGDPDRQIAFYTGLLGWRQEGEMPMGELGAYRFLQHGDYAVGAVMPRSDAFPFTGWVFYFRVADIDAGAEAVRAGGGSLVLEPSEIPGGEYALVARDPQGALFGLVGQRGQ